jgi:predicted phage tail component-like protein
MAQVKTYIDNTCLEDMGIVVERIHDDMPASRASTIEVPGRDGQVLTGITLEPRTITLECRCFCASWHDFDELRYQLAGLFAKKKDLQITTRNHPGEYYLAHLESITEGDREVSGIGYLELTFIADDPIRYGQIKTATVPSASSVTFTVGGTMPALVRVSATSAYRDSTSQVWGVKFDNSKFLHVPTGATLPRNVQINCATRSVTVAGQTKMVTLDSNWPVLEPGEHTAANDQGTGSSTITWQERSV